MNEYIGQQTQAFMANAANTQVQAFAQDSVARAREAFAKWSAGTQSGIRAIDRVMLANQSGAKTIGDKVLSHAEAAAEAAFDAAQAIVRARSVPEAAKLQADFMQQQMAIAGAQTKELLELSTQITRQALESMNMVASKSFEQFKV